MKKWSKKLLGIMLSVSMTMAAVFPVQSVAAESNGGGYEDVNQEQPSEEEKQPSKEEPEEDKQSPEEKEEPEEETTSETQKEEKQPSKEEIEEEKDKENEILTSEEENQQPKEEETAEAKEESEAEEENRQLWEEKENQGLISNIGRVREQLSETEGEKAAGGQNLLTLAGAGLLAGLNPCSVSMLLMLLSMIVSEKASVWKNGLLYLAGKYTAYVTIGLIIYVSAASLDGLILQDAGNILNKILVLLFGTAGILYLADAVRVFRQEYGKIRTQLPAGLRKWNHGLIRRVGNYSGMLKPLLILGLGMAISVGEFFCTGQIYMASITYLLKDQVSMVWISFLVYVTAMSLPAFLMLLIIQRTRNTELISEFMLRHMGAVKIFYALLFLGYALYFFLT